MHSNLFVKSSKKYFTFRKGRYISHQAALMLNHQYKTELTSGLYFEKQLAGFEPNLLIGIFWEIEHATEIIPSVKKQFAHLIKIFTQNSYVAEVAWSHAYSKKKIPIINANILQLLKKCYLIVQSIYKKSSKIGESVLISFDHKKYKISPPEGWLCQAETIEEMQAFYRIQQVNRQQILGFNKQNNDFEDDGSQAEIEIETISCNFKSIFCKGKYYFNVIIIDT